jgi:hypothetical protein
MSKTFICPMPHVWNEIYNNLLRVWRSKKESISKPPIPLILGAWQEPHIMKILRWKETIEWAEKHGYSYLIPELSEEESYFGD